MRKYEPNNIDFPESYNHLITLNYSLFLNGVYEKNAHKTNALPATLRI